MIFAEQNYGSFRDPSGSVFEIGERVFRGISEGMVEPIHKFINSPFYKKNAGRKIVKTKKIGKKIVLDAGLPSKVVNNFPLWVEHQRLEFITYPYEWCSEFLRKAAIFHLELKIDALNAGYIIKDSSAYNVQFIGQTPIFIDILSFEPYKDGSYWIGYKQFCEHFLGPLALSSYAEIEFNSWFRGSPDGLRIDDISRALPLKSYFSLTLLGNIHLHAWAISKIDSSTKSPFTKKNTQLPKKNLIAFLGSLKKFIMKLKLTNHTYWNDYSKKNSYSKDAIKEKEIAIRQFVIKNNLKCILDIGCNTGHFSKIALKAGAKKSIGLDIDGSAINQSVRECSSLNNNYIPLQYDLTNPSPSVGWGLKERMPLTHRLPKIDGVICLALMHHLIIGKNIPLSEFVRWVVDLAPFGIIEFIPKSDPMVINLLAFRKDIFDNYTESYFHEILKQHARIEQVIKSKNTMRKLFFFSRR